MFIQRWIVLGLAALCLLPAPALSQQTRNEFYAYRVSIGVGYVPLSPVGDVVRRATVNSIYGKVRLPIPSLPVVQPFFIVGLVQFDSDEQDSPTILGGVLDADAVMPDYDQRDTWDHRIIFGGLGIGYAYRITRDIEVGAEFSAALGQSIFPQRVVTPAGEWYPIGNLGLVLDLHGKIALNPTLTISLEVVPSLQYHRTFGNLPDFDGFYAGIGFAAHYRFVPDPNFPSRRLGGPQPSDV